MAPQRRLKGYERLEIIGAYNARVPLKEISRNTDISLSTVRRTVRKSQVRDEWQHDLPRSGRQRESTRAQDNRLHRHLRINKRSPVRSCRSLSMASRRHSAFCSSRPLSVDG